MTVSPDGTFAPSYRLIGDTALSSGRWYHVAGVFDAAAQTMTLYLDAQPDGTRSVSFSQIYNWTAPFMLRANAKNEGVIRYFDGLLDDWRVYSRALTQPEIQNLMNGP